MTTTTDRPIRPRHAAAALLAGATLLGGLAACGSSGGSDSAATGARSTTIASTPPATTTTTTPPEDDALKAKIQAIIDDALVTKTITWTNGGVDGSPTGVSVGVRRAGEDDIVLAAGSNVDTTPFDAAAPFHISTDSGSIVQQLGLHLVADGDLDPAATVDAWVPKMPGASTITVQMLLDDTTGWRGLGDESLAAITADLGRRWTHAEVVAQLADNPPLAEPGTLTVSGSRDANRSVLALIIEQVTGQPLARVLHDRLFAPAGWDDTFLTNGDDLPADFQAGVFVLAGKRMDTTQVPTTAFFTYNFADGGVVSTVADLLDVLDSWAAYRPGPANLLAARKVEGDTVIGQDVPFNGYCPCTPDGDGLEVTWFGRAGNGVGTDTQMDHFVDGTSIVLHFNSQEWTDKAPLQAITDAIHAAVVAAG